MSIKLAEDKVTPCSLCQNDYLLARLRVVAFAFKVIAKTIDEL